MYYSVTRSPGVIRIVESHKDELTEAAFYGALGLLALNFVVGSLEVFRTAEGFSRSLIIGAAFGSIFMLSTSVSSAVGRLARGRGRGKVIEIDLHQGRFRRYQNRWFFKKTGGEWQPFSESAQGARVVWKGPASQTALRLGQGRSFFFVTEPGEVGEEADHRLVAAINQELALAGVTSAEITAPLPPRERSLALCWRDAWEYLSYAFLTVVFGAFAYCMFLVSVVLDQMT